MPSSGSPCCSRNSLVALKAARNNSETTAYSRSSSIVTSALHRQQKSVRITCSAKCRFPSLRLRPTFRRHRHNHRRRSDRKSHRQGLHAEVGGAVPFFFAEVVFVEVF